MAIRYGKGLMGGAVVIALLALLVHWIGINTIEHYRDDLLFYLQAHLILVLASMLAALVVGIPAGIFLSRPTMVGRAERFMQIFNIGNTVPPLAVLAIALGILGIGSGPAIFALFLAFHAADIWSHKRSAERAFIQAGRSSGWMPPRPCARDNTGAGSIPVSS